MTSSSNLNHDPVEGMNSMSHQSSMNGTSPMNPIKDPAAASSPSASFSSPKKASPSDIIFGNDSSSCNDVKNIASLGLSSDSNSSIPASISYKERRASTSSNEPSTSTSTSNLPTPSSSSANTSNSNQISPTETTASSSIQTDANQPHSSTTAVLNPTVNGPPLDPVDKDQIRLLPPNFQDAEPDDIAVLVADMLTRLISHNDQLPLHPSSLTRFHSRATPGISIASYLRRIAKYTSLDKACTLILLVYIDRVCERLEGFTICGLTVHRFTCAAVVCASKALCDAFSTNGHYARVGGISLVELNMLEKEFLSIIDWRLTCSGALLQHYYVSLVKSHPAYALSETATIPAPSLAGMSLDFKAKASTSTSTCSEATDPPTRNHQGNEEINHQTKNPSRASASASIPNSPSDSKSNHSSVTPRTRSRSRSRSTSKQRKSSRRRTEGFPSTDARTKTGEQEWRQSRMDRDGEEEGQDKDGDGDGEGEGEGEAKDEPTRDVEMFEGEGEGDRQGRSRVSTTKEIQSGVG